MNSRIGRIRGWKHPLVILITSLLVLSSFWTPKVYAASTQVIYYFNGYDPSYTWPSDTEHDPSYMVDGNEWTHSGDGWENPADITQLCNSNTCPGTDLGAITKVEMQAKIDVYGSAGYLYITPKFMGGNGTTRLFQEVYAPTGGLTGWFDITSDPNAPSTWDWTHVKNLDVWIRGRHTVGYHDESCYKIWIRVSHPTENVDTYESSYSTLKGEYILPGDTVYAKAMSLTPGEAWLSGWDKRVKMTIDQGDVSGTLDDFPVLIHLSASSGQGAEDVSFVFDELTSDSNRKKIAVTTGDGMVECPVEIEKWDDATEQAWLWVKVPSVSSTSGTVLYLYYDKDHADNTNFVGDPTSAPAKNVWNANFRGVYHLSETTSAIKDSTGYENGNNGTAYGNPTLGATGKVDGAINFDGSDDNINLDDAFWGIYWAITIEGWVKPDVVEDSYWFSVGLNSPSGDGVVVGGLSNGKVEFETGNGTTMDNLASSGTYSTSLIYVVATWDGYTKRIYLNGVEDPNTKIFPYNINYDTYQDTYIGAGWDAGGYFDGIVDEVRISNTARSSFWIKASYESGRDHLVDYGGEETVGDAVASWLSGWKKRMKMTIDRADIGSGLTDFPVLLYLCSSSGIYKDSVVGVFNEVGSNSKKIAVTTSDGTTQCYVEIEKWDSTNKNAWLWTKVPTVSSTADTVLYLYYDASHADNTAYVGDKGSTPGQTVWDVNFKGVWHLNEDPSGTAPQMKDSTSNAKHGTANTTMTTSDQVTGKIDGSLDFDGTDDYVQTTSNDLKTANDFTIEVWFRAHATDFAHHIIWEGIAGANGWGNGGPQSNPEMHISMGRITGGASEGNYLSFHIGDTDDVYGNVIAISTGFSDTTSFYYVATVVQSMSTFPSAQMYLNSTSVGTDTASTTRTSRINWNVNLRIARPGANERHFDGIVDEVRISTAVRNSAWIKASYESGRDHLIDFGSEETRYDIKYYSDWLGTPVLEGSQSNVSQSPTGEWRSSYALQSDDPTGTWGVRVYDAGTSTLRASCSFTVVPKVPEFPLGAIVPLTACFSIYWAMRKNRKSREDIKTF